MTLIECGNIQRDCGPFRQPLILSLMILEHLKVTTRLALNFISSPVWGFLPLRSVLSFKQNFPKPDIRRFSPDSRVFLIISKRASTVDMDSCFGRLELLQMAFIKLDLVIVIDLDLLGSF